MSASKIFYKSTSAVTSGSPKLLAVATIMASGTLTLYFCLMDMAISLIESLKSIISQSLSNVWIVLTSCWVIFFFPYNSISEITEIASENFDIFDTTDAGCFSKKIK